MTTQAMTTEVRAVSAQEMLDLWEAGRARHPVDRAVLLLAAADRGLAGEDLPRLPVGVRDEHLLRLYQATFGDRVDGRATCPECAEALQLSLGCDDLLAVGTPDRVPGAELVVHEGDYHLTFRLPNSTDLAAVAGFDTVDDARPVILERCVTGIAGPDGATPRSLPESVVSAIAASMSEADPRAEFLIDLVCPACNAGWEASFDIVSALWVHVSTHARRLILEVDALARAYGWRESEILALSPNRRATYLELAVG